jgi:acetyl esterase/lipase
LRWLSPHRSLQCGRICHFRVLDTGNLAPEHLPLNILYYRPITPGTHPILIDIYGGAWQRGAPASDRNFNSYMAFHGGYAVFAIDYRHAPEFKYPAQLHDVRTAVQFIHDHAAEYNGDPDRIVLFGRSSGGHLALLAAYAQVERRFAR